MTYDQLLSKEYTTCSRRKEKKDAYNKKIQELEVLANNKSLDLHMNWFLKMMTISDHVRLQERSSVCIRTCITIQKNLTNKKSNDKFSKVFKTIENAYQNIKEKNNCTVYIDFPENIYKLHKALNRDKVYNTVGNRLESIKGKKAFVTHHGISVLKNMI